MSINFTGVQNTGFFKVVANTPSKIEGQVFSTQLTDDEKGKDLAEFKEALDKSDVADCSYSGQISLYSIKKYPYNEDEIPKYEFYLNGMPLEIKDKNLPMFDYLAKITRKVLNQPKKDMVVDKEFVSGPNVRFGMLPGIDMKSYFEHRLGQNYEEGMNKAYDKNNAKRGAQTLNDSIHEAMYKYLCE